MADPRGVAEVCHGCGGVQRVAEYVLPDGSRVEAKYACQVCGRGEQESVAAKLEAPRG